MISLLLLEKVIPNNKARIIINKSNNYYADYYKEQKSNINNIKYKRSFVDVTGELAELSIIYLEDNKNPYSEMIEMNYDFTSATKLSNGREVKHFTVTNDYSRYWHGNIVLLKPLLSLFDMYTIKKIYFVFFSLLFCILLFKLLQNSKLLAASFVVAALSINMFLITKCTNLMNVFIIAMITSILLINKYKKNDKNIDILFLIIGMLTSYFDLITCETITLTLPLFIYIFLHIKDNKRLDYKLIIKIIIIWLLGYAISYLAKWLLLVIHYHGHFIEKVIEPMKVRVYTENTNIFKMFVINLKDALSFIIPYKHNFKLIFIIVSTLLIIINLLTNKKNRIPLLLLLFLSIVPFVRYFTLSSHVNYHNYFTYRAFFPFVMLLVLTDLIIIFKIIKKGIN